MKDTAPKELGIVAVAALFGFLALLVSYFVLDLSGFAACLAGAVVAIVTALVLWLGWREPAPGPTGPRDLSAEANAKSATQYASMTTAPAATAASSASADASGSVTGSDAGSAAGSGSSTAGASSAASASGASEAGASEAGASTTLESAPAAAMPTETAAPAKAKAAPAQKAEKPAAKTAKAAAKADDSGPVMEGKPETLTAARAGGPDDLKRIKGVGPQLEGVLNDMGFYHFDQIAKWGDAEIAWVDSRLKFKGRIVRDDWVKQATEFAAE